MGEQVVRYKLVKENDSVETLFDDVRDEYIARGWVWVNKPGEAKMPAPAPAATASGTMPAPKKQAKSED